MNVARRPAASLVLDVLRRWWPVAAFVAVSVAVQRMTYTDRWDVGGHASEHLASGTFVFFASVVAATLLWLSAPARRSLIVIIGVVTWLGAGVAIAAGNVRVVDALIDSGQAWTSTDDVVGSRAIDDAHFLANNAPYVAVLGALAIILGLLLAGAVARGLAIACALLTVVIPPWILPGVGVVVATVALGIAREREAWKLRRGVA
jgi:hypothetical protein